MRSRRQAGTTGRQSRTDVRKAVLLILFVPSVERDGVTPVAQEKWVRLALEAFGKMFGGATAYPKARGVWRDDERGGALVYDEPVVIHCYTTPKLLHDGTTVDALLAFCRRLGNETRQGEVGLVIDNEYLTITDFGEV